MPNAKPTDNTEDLRQQVKRLQESLRELHANAAEAKPQADGLAEGVVAALGKLVPGLGKLVEAAQQMPEFHQRLAAIDEEVKRKFKEQPLNRAAVGVAGMATRRQMGIPPAVRRAETQRHGTGSAGAARPASGASGQGQSFGGARGPGKRERTPRPPKVHINPQTPAQLPVDIFDEGPRIVVLAEAPGLELEHITVTLEGTVLVISIDAPHRSGVQRVELPCDVAGDPDTSLANGILNIHMKKASAK